MFGSTCFVLLLQVEISKLSSRSSICGFFWLWDGRKGYVVMIFLEHIPFYSLSSESHNHIRSDLTLINPFLMDCGDSNNSNIENCRVDTDPSAG